MRRHPQSRLAELCPKGEKHVQPMTNNNDLPYQDTWFPSFKDTRKIENKKENKEVGVSFPVEEEGKWYRIKGKARLAMVAT